ncbi:MAG: RagB/SusD family nutrient uptake outer membrane protein [Chitinophagaceae bacterium]
MLQFQKHSTFKIGALGLFLLLMVTGCKKFVEVKAPTSSINEGNVYQSDATAIAALTGILSQMASGSVFSGGSGMSLYEGLSADELTLTGAVTDAQLLAYYRNQLRTGPNGNFGIDYWRSVYPYIFESNAAIAGLNKSESLTPAVKTQLLGEAKFLRAFFYFYLVNLYGDAPLVLSTNPNENAVLPRSPKDNIYAQIVADLKDAQNLLSSSFLDAGLLKSTSERVRPTKWAATALLARTYLYMGEYANAEAEATSIIAASGQFSLSPLNAVFLKNSTEAIWQLQPVGLGMNTLDAMIFVLPSTGPNASANPVHLSAQQLAAFEAGDLRRKGGNWVDSVISGGNTYFYPAKYKAKTISGSSFTEYLVLFRLAEQYLIRAESRAQLNNFQGAKDDLNAIRTRAGLQNTTANDQASLLAAILKERQVELFTELGQRWLDLKRTGKVDEVMTVVTSLKANGATWKSYQQLYPVPFNDLQLNPKLVQNVGY